MDAAYKAGCRKFDGALLGFGGCPMAKDDLVGNMPMENMIKYVEGLNEPTHYDPYKLKEALEMAHRLYHETTA
jgi:hydroxymethylglutaryl-CoA lyase